MAIANSPSQKVWLVPAAVIVAGLAVTLLLWGSAGRLLHQLNQSQAQVLHDAAQRHLRNTLNREEVLAELLATAIAESTDPAQTFERVGEPLLALFPELIALERYSAMSGAAAGPESWRQIQSLSRAQTAPDQGLQPYQVPHWRPALKRAWDQQSAGVTPLAAGSGALSEADSSRPSVHLFWPVARQSEQAVGELAAPQLLGLMLSPDQLLAELPTETSGATLGYSLFDLDSQASGPIAMAAEQSDPELEVDASTTTQVFEDRLSLLDRNWLLRTTFDFQLPPEARGFLQAILVLGTALTLLVALLSLRLIQNARRHEEAASRATQRWKIEHQAGQNAALEKGILGRALMDSEQRTRDFVDLGNGFSCELDDDWRIGFISSQIAGILDRSAADLAGHSLLKLVPAREHEPLTQALDTCCRERRTVMVNTFLLQPGERECPISLRITPVTDGIGHCTGYRAVGWRR